MGLMALLSAFAEEPDFGYCGMVVPGCAGNSSCRAFPTGVGLPCQSMSDERLGDLPFIRIQDSVRPGHSPRLGSDKHFQVFSFVCNIILS